MSGLAHLFDIDDTLRYSATRSRSAFLRLRQIEGLYSEPCSKRVMKGPFLDRRIIVLQHEFVAISREIEGSGSDCRVPILSRLITQFAVYTSTFSSPGTSNTLLRWRPALKKTATSSDSTAAKLIRVRQSKITCVPSSPITPLRHTLQSCARFGCWVATWGSFARLLG